MTVLLGGDSSTDATDAADADATDAAAVDATDAAAVDATDAADDAETARADAADARQSSTAPVVDEWAIRRIVRTMIPLLAGLSVLQLVSGSVLESFEATLLQYPALLVLLPVQIGTAGNLASIMCSRLTTQLYLGTYEPRLSNPDVRANVIAVFALAATVFGLVGVAAWAIGLALGGSLGVARVLTVSIVSGMLLAVVVVTASVVAVEASYRVGLNPDDTTIPIVTNVCDITGVLILFAVVSVVV